MLFKSFPSRNIILYTRGYKRTSIQVYVLRFQKRTRRYRVYENIFYLFAIFGYIPLPINFRL